MSPAARPILETNIQKAEVRDLYRTIAPKYDAWAACTESKARRRCLELAAIQNGESVLEVAVGTGLAFADILTRNPAGRNEGIDLTQEMLERARKRAQATGRSNYRLQLGDAYDLDYEAETFDVVINNYMFDLLPEKDFPVVLEELKRVLRPGGRLVLVSMAQGEHWYNLLWEGIYRLNPRWLGGCRGVTLLPPVREAGFEQTRREFVSQMTFPSEIVYAVKPSTGRRLNRQPQGGGT